MRAPHRRIRRTAAMAAVFLLSACAAPSTPAGSPSGPAESAAASSSPATDGTAAAVVGSFAPGQAVLELSSDPLVAIGNVEVSDRAAGRKAADMTGHLGPGASDLAAAIDRLASERLLRLLAGSPPGAATRSPGPVFLSPAARYWRRRPSRDPAWHCSDRGSPR